MSSKIISITSSGCSEETITISSVTSPSLLSRKRQFPTTPKSKETLVIPIEKKDDEVFKLSTIKKIKKKSFPPFSSVKKLRKSEWRKSLDNAIEFSRARRIGIVHSVKKFVFKVKTLYADSDNKRGFKFPMFYDNQIGIGREWQLPIKDMENEEDYNTDEEDLRYGEKSVVRDIKRGVRYVEENGMDNISD